MGSSLRRALERAEPHTQAEARDLARLLAIVDGDAWSRSTPLHVTGSALVVHPASERVLLRWHQRQQAWLQVGGHGDPGEDDPLEIALREGREETGLADLRPWPEPDPAPVHVVVVQVAANDAEPDHEHGDMRYLLATDRPEDAVPEDDGAPLRWCTFAEARELTAEPNLRATLRRAGRLLAAGGASDH